MKSGKRATPLACRPAVVGLMVLKNTPDRRDGKASKAKLAAGTWGLSRPSATANRRCRKNFTALETLKLVREDHVPSAPNAETDAPVRRAFFLERAALAMACPGTDRATRFAPTRCGAAPRALAGTRRAGR